MILVSWILPTSRFLQRYSEYFVGFGFYVRSEMKGSVCNVARVVRGTIPAVIVITFGCISRFGACFIGMCLVITFSRLGVNRV